MQQNYLHIMSINSIWFVTSDNLFLITFDSLFYTIKYIYIFRFYDWKYVSNFRE